MLNAYCGEYVSSVSVSDSQFSLGLNVLLAGEYVGNWGEVRFAFFPSSYRPRRFLALPSFTFLFAYFNANCAELI